MSLPNCDPHAWQVLNKPIHEENSNDRCRYYYNLFLEDEAIKYNVRRIYMFKFDHISFIREFKPINTLQKDDNPLIQEMIDWFNNLTITEKLSVIFFHKQLEYLQDLFNHTYNFREMIDIFRKENQNIKLKIYNETLNEIPCINNEHLLWYKTNELIF